MLKKCNTKNVFPYWSRRKAHAMLRYGNLLLYLSCCILLSGFKKWIEMCCKDAWMLECARVRDTEEQKGGRWLQLSGERTSALISLERHSLLKRTRSPWANQKPSANLLPESIVQSGRRTPAPCQSVNQSLFFFNFQVKVCSFCKFINGGQTQHLYLGTASARLECW